jgi:hypothetical protein
MEGGLIKDVSEEYPVTNGIFPIWGITLYTMPICYLYANANDAYIIFREMYIRFFFPLHSLNETTSSIFYQSTLFENLLKEKDSQLYFYLAFDLGVFPLDIAFKWMLYCFVGVLDVEQVLLMWDRMIGYDTTDILALTAAALFWYRREELMQCKSQQDVSVNASFDVRFVFLTCL